MVQIDLRAVHEGPVEIAHSVAPDHPLIAQIERVLCGGIHLSGRLMEVGPGQYFWHGRIRSAVRSECRRCLAELEVPVDEAVDVLFTEEPDPDDPAAYGIRPRATELDLSEAVREELVLAVPEYVLCREDCRGLCPRCGTDLNTGGCACTPAADARWAALEHLETAGPDHARE